MKPVFSYLRTLLVLAVLAIGVSSMLHAAPYLKSGDRVVIYGDSITQQLKYSRFLQQYFSCRYPEMNLRFFNAGWSGDTAGGALNRLDRDVLVLKPTVVTLFFGMNDGRYTSLNNDIIAQYRSNMEKLITTLQGKGIRVVVFTPGCVDPDQRKNLGDVNYNAMLEALGKADLELAAQYKCVSGDVFHPMLSFMTAQKAANPKFTMIPDAVHPSDAGHLVMAQVMLKALGAEPMPELGTIDLGTNTASGVSVVSKDENKIVLQTVGAQLNPYWFSSDTISVMKDSGFLDMAGRKLVVKGLTGATYSLTIDGAKIGAYTKDQLANGISVPGSYSQRGRTLHDTIMNKENNYFNAWRNIRLPMINDAVTPKMFDLFLASDEAYQGAISELAKPVDKMTITLENKPEGMNLAEGKSYVTSDTNNKGWGATSLTDGSWEMNQAHCWASNDSATFPKTVTIDLQTSASLNTVIVGVPNFGSTRTIKVSVSNDGTNFTEVGTHEFKLKTEEKYTYRFDPVVARYVRLTYPDHYDELAGYPNTFSFTTEVEVYGK